MWSGKDVLDFGGNIGNILRDPAATIDEERYWCLDVVKDSIEHGKVSFPKAHWRFYNRYSFFFNPHGVPQLPLPDLGQKFDYIVAYSVFSNTTPTDMLQLVKQLEGLLTSDGTLAFTFIDPYHFSWPGQYRGNNFQWRLDRELELAQEGGYDLNLDTAGLTKKAQNADWLLLVNADDLYIETEELHPYEPDAQRTCHAFYTPRFMKNLFPKATILPPVNNEMQHCCVIRKSAMNPEIS
ncbi:MAG TPA: class I SAM-dependent methyltransferase [Pyrinomonadaceae bacterium]|nr:class I SAM-dependent methyltransferase [Pyrinomonadaceae bacterium]